MCDGYPLGARILRFHSPESAPISGNGCALTTVQRCHALPEKTLSPW